METAAIILAAGAGTRMKSTRPKVVHELLGKPLISWVIAAAEEVGITQIVAVVGHQKEQVIPLVQDRCIIVEQPERRGTADAVNVCQDAFAAFDGSLVVLSGDCPLISPTTIDALIQLREKEDAAVVVLTTELDDPTGYGRIVRDENGCVARIVEQKDASEEELRIRECNSGFYCFDARVLFSALSQVDSDNNQNEFYLTDVIGICRNEGRKVMTLVSDDPAECLGINSRVQLAQATKVAQRHINLKHMENGVTMLDPTQVWIGPDVCLESDVEILPQVFLMGETRIGKDSVIGPHSRLTNTIVGKCCTIDETIAQDVIIDDQVKCGPRAYLRPGTHMCEGSKAGTHVEIKKDQPLPKALSLGAQMPS